MDFRLAGLAKNESKPVFRLRILDVRNELGNQVTVEGF
jgi:hypothetical protein